MNLIAPRAGLPGSLFWQLESGRRELDGKKSLGRLQGLNGTFITESVS